MTSATAWPKGSVKDVAESLGISNLNDELSSALAADVEYRIRELIEESNKFMRHAKRTRLVVEDVNLAMKVKNIEPLWGFSSPHAPISYRKTPHPSGNLYFLEDEEIDLAKYSQEPLPPIPREVSYTAHWLAVEGVQPAIPQNPSPADIRLSANNARSSSRVTAVGPENADIKPIVAHALSKELQLYFDRLTSAAVDTDDTVRTAALESFRGDTGLQGLVAYLLQWVSERVVNSLNSTLSGIEQCLDILEAMLQNKSLFIDPYLHQILPSALSILLISSLGPPQTGMEQSEMTHITLRQHAASFLKSLLTQYASAYASLRPRILQTILRGLISGCTTDTRQAGTLTGAILGIQAMGKEAVRRVFGSRNPNLSKVGETLQRETFPEAEREICTNVLLDALQEAYPTIGGEAGSPDYQELEGITGQYFGGFVQSRCTPSVAIGILETFSDESAPASRKRSIAAVNGTGEDKPSPRNGSISNSSNRDSDDAEGSGADEDAEESGSGEASDDTDMET